MKQYLYRVSPVFNHVSAALGADAGSRFLLRRDDHIQVLLSKTGTHLTINLFFQHNTWIGEAKVEWCFSILFIHTLPLLLTQPRVVHHNPPIGTCQVAILGQSQMSKSDQIVASITAAIPEQLIENLRRQYEEQRANESKDPTQYTLHNPRGAGRRTHYTAAEDERILSEHKQEKSIREIEAATGIPRSRVHRVIQSNESRVKKPL